MNLQHDASQQRLRELVSELERIVPRDDAQIQLGLDEIDEDSFDLLLLANRNGFLRFGVELLKAASAPGQSEERQELHPDVDYLVAETSSFDNYRFVLDENHNFRVDEDEEAQNADLPMLETFKDASRTAFLYGVLIFFVVAVIIGMATFSSWLTK